jgi:hypothetical protein
MKLPNIPFTKYLLCLLVNSMVIVAYFFIYLTVRNQVEDKPGIDLTFLFLLSPILLLASFLSNSLYVARQGRKFENQWQLTLLWFSGEIPWIVAIILLFL